MALFRLRGSGRRLAVVDEYAFPASVRQRLAHQRPELTSDNLQFIETGARRWFRLAARHPKARLSMPSVLVDDLWHELVLHTRDYAEFCDAAFGRFLHHVPESAMSADGAADNRSGGLRATFQMAQQDEGCAPALLPVLFRVDQEIGVEGGRRYLADCGGRGLCYELKGTICLQHIGGPGKRSSGDWNFTRRDVAGGGMSSAGCGAGGGCGGGCGGGN